MSKYPFFYYDPEGDGFQRESSLEVAEKQSNEAIRQYLDDCWSEEVEGVCMGVVLKRAKKTYTAKRPPDSELDGDGYDKDGNWWGRQDSGEGTSEYDEICDYTLEPVKIPAEVLALIPTADLVRGLVMRKDEVAKLSLPDDEWTFGGKLAHPIEQSYALLDEKGPATILVVRGNWE